MNSYQREIKVEEKKKKKENQKETGQGQYKSKYHNISQNHSRITEL